MYNFVRSRQLEGTFELNGSIGVFPLMSLRICKGWGNPPEDAWPYNGNAKDWPPQDEPKEIDTIAKRNRIGVYQRIRSLREIKIALSNEKPIVLTLLIFKQWYHCKDGRIEIPKDNEHSTGLHSILIIGYDDSKSEFKFTNSWGISWGDSGMGYLPYVYSEKYFGESWIISDSSGELPRTNNNGVNIINYGIPDILGDTIHVVEIFDSQNDDFVGWSFGVIRNGYFEIEEFFVHPNYRHRSYGIQLAIEMLNVSRKMGLRIRVWISEADIERDNFYVVEKILSRMELIPKVSSVSWAAFECTKEHSV